MAKLSCRRRNESIWPLARSLEWNRIEAPTGYPAKRRLAGDTQARRISVEQSRAATVELGSVLLGSALLGRPSRHLTRALSNGGSSNRLRCPTGLGGARSCFTHTHTYTALGTHTQQTANGKRQSAENVIVGVWPDCLWAPNNRLSRLSRARRLSHGSRAAHCSEASRLVGQSASNCNRPIGGYLQVEQNHFSRSLASNWNCNWNREIRNSKAPTRASIPRLGAQIPLAFRAAPTRTRSHIEVWGRVSGARAFVGRVGLLAFGCGQFRRRRVMGANELSPLNNFSSGPAPKNSQPFEGPVRGYTHSHTSGDRQLPLTIHQHATVWLVGSSWRLPTCELFARSNILICVCVCVCCFGFHFGCDCD